MLKGLTRTPFTGARSPPMSMCSPVLLREKNVDVAVQDTDDIKNDLMRFCDESMDVLVMGCRGLNFLERYSSIVIMWISN